MWNLLRHEFYKLWSQRLFSISLAILCGLNLFFLWNDNRGSVPGSAYRALDSALAQMDAAERLPYLQEKQAKIYGLYQLDYYLLNGYNNPNGVYYATFLDRWEEYRALYEEGNYLEFTDCLADEYRLLAEACEEAGYVNKFHERLNSVQAASQSLSQISIFKQNNYNQKNIDKTARDYAGMEGVEPQFQLQKCWYTATEFYATDYILIGMVLFCSFFIVRQEQDNGVLFYLWSTPSGRLKLALTKWLTFCISLLAMIGILYGVNCCWCISTYSAGDLSVPVQSLAFLRDCPLKITLGQYLLLYWGTKFLASCVLGTFLLLCALWGRQMYTAYFPAIAFIAANNLLYSVLPAFGTLNFFRYCNLFGILKTNTVLAEYQNLYWFGQPVSKWTAQLLFGSISFALFGGLFLLLFVKKQRPVSTGRLARLLSFRTVKSPVFMRASGVVGTEFYKVFIKNGALAVLAVFLVFQTYQTLTYEDYMTPDEMQYNYYMEHLSGRYGEKQYQWLLQKQKKFAPITELQAAYAAGELTEAEYEAGMFPLYNLNSEYGAYQSAVSHLSYLKENPGAQYINENGYMKLFGFKGNQNRTDALFAVVLCILCCAGAFSVDYSSGMVKVIAATPKGRTTTARIKILIAFCVSVLIALLTSAPHFITVYQDYGMTSLLGSAYSISLFQNLPGSFTVSDLILVSLLLRILALFSIALVILWISNATKDAMKSIFLSFFFFCVPIFLSIYFIPALQWLTIYPCFHFAVYVSLLHQQGWSVFGSLLWLVSAGGLAVLSVVPFFGTEMTLGEFIKKEILYC